MTILRTKIPSNSNELVDWIVHSLDHSTFDSQTGALATEDQWEVEEGIIEGLFSLYLVTQRDYTTLKVTPSTWAFFPVYYPTQITLNDVDLELTRKQRKRLKRAIMSFYDTWCFYRPRRRATEIENALRDLFRN